MEPIRIPNISIVAIVTNETTGVQRAIGIQVVDDHPVVLLSADDTTRVRMHRGVYSFVASVLANPEDWTVRS